MCTCVYMYVHTRYNGNEIGNFDDGGDVDGYDDTDDNNNNHDN